MKDRDFVINAEIGNRIRTARLRRGLTLQDLAAALDITYQQVQKYETGQNSVASCNIPRLCEVLRMTPAHLLGMD